MYLQKMDSRTPMIRVRRRARPHEARRSATCIGLAKALVRVGCRLGCGPAQPIGARHVSHGIAASDCRPGLSHARVTPLIGCNERQARIRLWMRQFVSFEVAHPECMRSKTRPFMTPSDLSQVYLAEALARLEQAAGPSPSLRPALAFVVCRGAAPDPLSSGLHALVLPCVTLHQPEDTRPAPPGLPWIHALAQQRAEEPWFLHLGAWVQGPFRVPVQAPGRWLAGCCPVEDLRGGRLARHLEAGYHPVSYTHLTLPTKRIV